ncbi:hypothetical protein [Adonisia turfae]|uniref:Uncharacterized protein n=1 Tax=Adonisia turfae CCMR0081 TaxID=2292702 RepID=A0A6M0RQQ7_9CYAN|nr:hypothetical protein [Adonisia turfae]NEZ58577.1 hypothetical protein [Adonisia turfae CCMR0081]
MGVFQLMGLGKSPGVISAPISYFSHCYKRSDWRNPINFALQLATTLSGSNARMYYMQAQNADTETEN